MRHRRLKGEYYDSDFYQLYLKTLYIFCVFDMVVEIVSFIFFTFMTNTTWITGTAWSNNILTKLWEW